MPEAIIDWSTGYFDKISLFVYANLEELFQEGKEGRKNTADQELPPARVSPSQR